MSDIKGFYRTLGLPPRSSYEDIRKAYLKLAVKYHPDKITDEKLKKIAKEKFIEISNAHEFLSDPVNKRDYDNDFIRSEDNGYYGNYYKFDDIFRHFDKMFKYHFDFINRNFFEDRFKNDFFKDKFRNLPTDGNYRSVQQTTRTKIIDGKKHTIIEEIEENNGQIKKTTTIIDDKGKRHTRTEKYNKSGSQPKLLSNSLKYNRGF